MIWSENEARIDNAYDLSLRAWKRNCFYARKWFALAVCLSGLFINWKQVCMIDNICQHSKWRKSSKGAEVVLCFRKT